MSLGRLLYLFLLAAGATLLLRAFAFEGVYVASGSMLPTLPVGNHLVLDKLTFRCREPRRGEIIVFSSPVPPVEDMIKRVIAIPGDTVELKRKQVVLNGSPLEEPYARHVRAAEELSGDNLEAVTVPPNAFFVLGDNRDESNDSSVWRDSSGNRVLFVPRSAVRGKLRGFY